jgi:hypothetical protein
MAEDNVGKSNTSIASITISNFGKKMYDMIFLRYYNKQSKSMDQLHIASFAY